MDGPSSNMNGALMRRGDWDTDVLSETIHRSWGERPRKEATLPTPGSHTCSLQHNEFLLFDHPIMWYLILVTWASSHTPSFTRKIEATRGDMPLAPATSPAHIPHLCFSPVTVEDFPCSWWTSSSPTVSRSFSYWGPSPTPHPHSGHSTIFLLLHQCFLSHISVQTSYYFPIL